MRVTLDWDDAPSLAANFTDAVDIGSGDGDLWDLAASANSLRVDPTEVVHKDADGDGSDPEAVQTALEAFAEMEQGVSATQLNAVAERLDLDTLPNGSHFAGYGRNLTLAGMVALRSRLGDDGRRLDLDRNRIDRGSPHLQLLFDRKYVDRTENPSNRDEEGPTWVSGKEAQYVAGTALVDADDRVKDPETGRLDYQKIIEQLADHPDFGTRADLYRRLAQRGSITFDTEPRKRGYDHAKGRRPIPRPVKKALRDYAEDRDLGHYAGGRARTVTYSDELPEGTAERTRRALVEYVDVVWSGDHDRDEQDDYFRELNVTTSTLNDNNTNRQLKVSHDHAVKRAMDRLNPTAPSGGEMASNRANVTLEHKRDRAANIAQAKGPAPMGEMGETSRNPDSLNWEDRRIDADEVPKYLDNLPTSNPAEIDRAETNPIIEVTLYGEDPVNDDPIWHVIVLDDGDRLSDGTVIEDSRGWW